MPYSTLEQIIGKLSEGIRPPRRMAVSEAAAKYRHLNNPGVYVGPWTNEKTPYLVDFMDVLTSPDYTGAVFVGPAQSGKTDVFTNWLTYSVECDPADLTLFHMTQASGRDFYHRRVERFYRDNPNIVDHILPGKHNRSQTMTRFSSGMLLTMSYPSISELSGRPIPRLWLTDYDRMTQNVEGEGSPFFLAKKRATTFRQRGMTVAESSPGFEVDNPRWLRTSDHEAPPTTGILALYNMGDRRKWYWPCPKCNGPFEPTFELIKYEVTDDFMHDAENAYMECPNCRARLTHAPTKHGGPGKDALNLKGQWLAEGEKWTPGARGGAGVVTGKSRRSDVASFWLNGAAASFTDWRGLVYNYLKALDDFNKTGSQEALKTTINTDQGMPYLPRGNEGGRLPEDLKEQTGEIEIGFVPPEGRFLVATVDVQKNRFVVQVHAFGKGGDVWVIDRFDVKLSKRIDPTTGEHFWLSPGSYLEDWNELIPKVLMKSYPLHGDKRERHMAIKVVLCDSGGREGVTTNAYNFWRFLRDGPDNGVEPPEGYVEGLATRFQLVRGASRPGVPRVAMTFPDTDRKDRRAAARGEVPILQINSNVMKDTLNAMLSRKEPGGGKITFGFGLSESFFTELVAETRTMKGWQNLRNLRNESWDLLVYALAGSISRHVGIERIDWESPPNWAEEWDKNSFVYGRTSADSAPFVVRTMESDDMSDVAKALL